MFETSYIKPFASKEKIGEKSGHISIETYINDIRTLFSKYRHIEIVSNISEKLKVIL